MANFHRQSNNTILSLSVAGYYLLGVLFCVRFLLSAALAGEQFCYGDSIFIQDEGDDN